MKENRKQPDMGRAASLHNETALECHLQRRQRQMEHDRTAMEIMRKGLDVPFSRIQEKNHQGIV